MLKKKIIDKFKGHHLLGIYEFIRSPDLQIYLSKPFNGQKFRKELFHEIVDEFNFKVIIETGTFRGASTLYLAENSKAKVYSVESNKQFFAFSKLKYLLKKKIVLKRNDSRLFLKKLLKKEALKNDLIFFYLDAHWGDDLPLIDELKIIFDKCPTSIIMIDDFQVPDDPGYKFDDYGPGQRLTQELLNQLDGYKHYRFYPSVSCDKETGQKRGCVVLTQSLDIRERLSNLNLLRTLDQ